MSSHYSHIPKRLKCRAIKQTKNMILLSDYAAQTGYTKGAIYHQIAKGRVIGFKIRGKWYISTEG